MTLWTLRDCGHARRRQLRRALTILAALTLLPIASVGLTGCEDEVVEGSSGGRANPNAKPAAPRRQRDQGGEQREAAAATSTGGWQPVYGDRRLEQGRDPFYGFIDEIIAQRARAAEEARQAAADLDEEPLKPAQRFDVSDFLLVAVITNTAQTKALLIDPHGDAHRLRVGDLIGRKNGVIVDIRRDEVEVLQGENLLEGETYLLKMHPELPPGVQIEFR